MSNITKAFVFLVLILALRANSQANDTDILGPLLTGNLVRVSGKAYCSPDGNPCPHCPPLSNVKVELMLGSKGAGSSVTERDGSFQIDANNVFVALAALFDPNALKVSIKLPALSPTCRYLFHASGSLEGPTKLKGFFNHACIDVDVPSFSHV